MLIPQCWRTSQFRQFQYVDEELPRAKIHREVMDFHLCEHNTFLEYLPAKKKTEIRKCASAPELSMKACSIGTSTVFAADASNIPPGFVHGSYCNFVLTLACQA